jgi:hypothetical protein
MGVRKHVVDFAKDHRVSGCSAGVKKMMGEFRIAAQKELDLELGIAPSEACDYDFKDELVLIMDIVVVTMRMLEVLMLRAARRTFLGFNIGDWWETRLT